jgi:phage gpG-like protein
VLIVIAGWFYWTWPRRVDMASYVPADCVAFVEADDLVELADGVGSSEAWTKLAAPLGARATLLPNRWLIQLARWAGIGSGDVILFARSQFAIVFTGIEQTEADATLKIKPLTTLIIETHTTQRRMRSILERHVEDFARAHGQPSLVQKQIDGVDLSEWSSADKARHITLAFVGTLAIVGNDEASVLHCVDVRRGKRASLLGNQQLEHARAQVDAAGAPLFGFVSKAGVNPILQAWALYFFSSNQNATTIARIFANVFSNLIEGFAWTSRFTEGRAEDRCFLQLSEGVADKLRGSAVPEDRAPSNEMTFVPPDAYSVSVYHFRDVERLWRDVNATLSSHSDVVGAIAAGPLLRSLFPPYGINDPDTFVSAVGTRMATIRLEENASSVLIAGAFDRPRLRKIVEQRLGRTAYAFKF